MTAKFPQMLPELSQVSNNRADHSFGFFPLFLYVDLNDTWLLNLCGLHFACTFVVHLISHNLQCYLSVSLFEFQAVTVHSTQWAKYSFHVCTGYIRAVNDGSFWFSYCSQDNMNILMNGDQSLTHCCRRCQNKAKKSRPRHLHQSTLNLGDTAPCYITTHSQVSPKVSSNLLPV